MDNMIPICQHGIALTHPTGKALVDGWADRETDLSKLTFPSLISFCKSSTAAVYVIWAKSLWEERKRGVE